MKQKLTLLLSLLVVVTCATAQMADSKFTSAKKGNLLGIHLTALDVYTPATFKQTNTPRTFTNLRKMDIGVAVSYWRGLTKTIDFSTKVGFSMDDFNSTASNRVNFNNENQYAVEVEPSLNFRPYGDNALVAPFLSVGIGGGRYSHDYGAYVPAGVGVQVNLQSNTYLFVQSQYRFALTKDVLKDAISYSVGVAQNFSKPKPIKVVEAPMAPVVLDRDGDGVVDADDKCPDVPGLAALNGCPDADGDGIADADDKCPTVAGLAKYQGCPIPDTDGDGINDEQDKCPTVKGLARYQGCPIPDTDGDGVNDEEDKCPTRKGPASNQGCPEIAKEVVEKINFAAKNVFFSTGSFKLLPKSFKSLDEVVTLLKADESLLIDVDGHTDAQGADDKNQTLSENRAAAVKNYLVSKGIAESRLKATGYGETKPVADNKTAAGRAKNRRTEMTVRNF
ncbi:OmpA family protein [Ferruginibacter yonginensis]|uniref:OmpA family protein n=1 Tax=Ferruginibacter yonginensis TaxID=1310416 RepID=A0ABV8QP01_9BACT